MLTLPHRLRFVWAIVLATAPSIGQVISGRIDPSFTQGELDQVLLPLGLFPNQRLAADSLYQGMAAAIRESGKGLPERYAKAFGGSYDQLDQRVTSKYRDDYADFIDARNKRERAFWLEFKAILTPEQLESKWPAVLRALHRRGIQDLPPLGPCAWGRFDLVMIVQTVRLTKEDEAAAAPVLARYELEIDRPLFQHHDQWDRAMLELKGMKEQAATMRENEAAIGRDVAEIDRKFARQLIEALPPDASALVDVEVHDIVYSRIRWIHRDSPDYMNRALALSDLTDHQRERLRAVQDSYEKNNAALVKKCEAEYDEATSKEMGRTVRQLANTDVDFADPSLVAEMGVDRELRQLEADTIKSINAELTERHVAALVLHPK